jgi:predicted CopG family antitoxin
MIKSFNEFILESEDIYKVLDKMDKDEKYSKRETLRKIARKYGLNIKSDLANTVFKNVTDDNILDVIRNGFLGFGRKSHDEIISKYENHKKAKGCKVVSIMLGDCEHHLILAIPEKEYKRILNEVN